MNLKRPFPNIILSGHTNSSIFCGLIICWHKAHFFFNTYAVKAIARCSSRLVRSAKCWASTITSSNNVANDVLSRPGLSNNSLCTMLMICFVFRNNSIFGNSNANYPVCRALRFDEFPSSVTKYSNGLFTSLILEKRNNQ